MVTRRIAPGKELPTTGEQPGNIYFEGQSIGQIPYAEWSGFEALDQTAKETYISEHFGTDVAGQAWGFAPAAIITQEQRDLMSVQPEGYIPGQLSPHGDGITTPVFGGGAEIPAPVVTPAPEVAPPPIIEPITVTPAPPYVVSPEQQEMQDLYGDKITDWVEAGGYGLDPETQAQMIQLQTDTLKARETEQIRVMKNNMNRRGIYNSGFLIAAESAIHSNTSVAIAGAIANVQIKSALMKMASFETAMGAMANFLGFLSEQSQLAYAPEFATWTAQTQADFAAWQANTGGTLEQWRMQEGNKFATWQAEQLATLQQWQGQMDIYKMELNQAYQTENIILQGEIQSQLNIEQNNFNLQLAEMEIETNQKIALYQGIGGIFGTVLGFIFGK